MKNHSYISMQQDMPDQGQLQVTVLDEAQMLALLNHQEKEE